MTIGIIQVGPGVIIGDDDLMERTYGDGDGVPHMQESSVQEYLQYYETINKCNSMKANSNFIRHSFGL